MLRIGTSGWNYPTGKGTWNGVFYPMPGDRPRDFDELSFYAERFNAVEVNSTFYGQPRANVTLGWVRRTPPDFEFAVKLFQKFTHPRLPPKGAERKPKDPTGPTHSDQINQEDIDTFRAGIDPLAAAGRLGPLLAQFPASFHQSPEALEYLDWLLQTFADYRVAVELRHHTWSDEPNAFRKLLTTHKASWVQIDEPKFDSSIDQDLDSGPGNVYYVRLHGRNAAQWWQHEQTEDRYNYRYSTQELAPIARKAQEARALAKKVYMFLNNHYSAQSVANAVTLKHMLDEPVTARMPAELVDRYPDLEGIVATLPRVRLL